MKLKSPTDNRFVVHLIIGQPLYPHGVTQIIGGYLYPEQADANLKAYLNITGRKHNYLIVPVMIMGRKPDATPSN